MNKLIYLKGEKNKNEFLKERTGILTNILINTKYNNKYRK